MSNASEAKYLVEADAPELHSTLKELMATQQHKYLVVNLIAKRARELNRGERAQVEVTTPHTPTELALAEIAANKLKLVHKPKNKVMISLIKND